MTDWLEELLGLAPQEDEGEEVFPLPRRRAAWSRAPEGERAGETQGGVGLTQGGQERANAGAEALTADWPDPVRSAEAEGDALPASGESDRPSWRGEVLRRRETARWGLEAGVSRQGESGLAALYRQVSRGQAGEVSLPIRAVRQRQVERETAAGTVGLTAEALDRTVRRDSRRYDGAMELY